MKMFDVQAIEIMAPHRKVFDFVKQPGHLPQWAHAFVSAGDGHARLETPAGAVDAALSVFADAETGIIDWRLAFADGNAGIAQSRVTETTRGTCIYSFVLHAPPVALEQLEGALEAQTRGNSAFAIRFSQQAQNMGLPHRRELHPGCEEESRRANAPDVRAFRR